MWHITASEYWSCSNIYKKVVSTFEIVSHKNYFTTSSEHLQVYSIVDGCSICIDPPTYDNMPD